MTIEASGFGVHICFADSVQLASWTFTNLSAPYWRLYWNESPGWCVHFDKQHVELLPDQIIIIPPNTAYSCSSTATPVHHYIEFTLSAYLHSVPAQIISIPSNIFGQQRLGQIANAIKNNSLTSEIKLQEHLLHALSLIADTLESAQAIPDPISKVMDFLGQHLNQRFDSAFLSDLAGLGHDTFPRYFRKHLGIGLQEWHMQKRIDAICTALHYTKHSLDSLAEEYGFSDRYHMTKLFTKHRAIGPATFRRQRYTGN